MSLPLVLFTGCLFGSEEERQQRVKVNRTEPEPEQKTAADVHIVLCAFTRLSSALSTVFKLRGQSFLQSLGTVTVPGRICREGQRERCESSDTEVCDRSHVKTLSLCSRCHFELLTDGVLF